MSTRRIFSKYVAMKLIRMGHDIVRCELNPKNDRLTVFVFEATEQFIKDLDHI
ncbi:hypothetical protein [Priestia aryabhattai]|uniref:hypothetical protein n=1 Tax=Priestia aryabhattai TaxID=412384 RepID=UPI002E24CA77|nr:hypothetical protein [Priestia aryabhattai]